MRQYSLAPVALALCTALLFAITACDENPLPTGTPITVPTLAPTTVSTPAVKLIFQAAARNGAPLTETDLNDVRAIVEERLRDYQLQGASVTIELPDRLIVTFPPANDLENVKQLITQTGNLELIDGGSNPPSEGDLVTTSDGPPESGGASPTAASRVWKTILSGDALDTRKVALVYSESDMPEVAFTLRKDATKTLCDFTTSHIGQYMPIVIDKRVIAVPIIKSPICGGNGVIDMAGSSDPLADARGLVAKLKSGVLPVHLIPAEGGSR